MAVVVKNPPASAGNIRDTGSIPGPERYSGEGNGNPPPHSSILAWIIPMDRGAGWAIVHGISELDTTERLSPHSFFPKPPSHPGWHKILSKVPCAMQLVLVGYPF